MQCEAELAGAAHKTKGRAARPVPKGGCQNKLRARVRGTPPGRYADHTTPKLLNRRYDDTNFVHAFGRRKAQVRRSRALPAHGRAHHRQTATGRRYVPPSLKHRTRISLHICACPMYRQKSTRTCQSGGYMYISADMSHSIYLDDNTSADHSDMYIWFRDRVRRHRPRQPLPEAHAASSHKELLVKTQCQPDTLVDLIESTNRNNRHPISLIGPTHVMRFFSFFSAALPRLFRFRVPYFCDRLFRRLLWRSRCWCVHDRGPACRHRGCGCRTAARARGGGNRPLQPLLSPWTIRATSHALMQ